MKILIAATVTLLLSGCYAARYKFPEEIERDNFYAAEEVKANANHVWLMNFYAEKNKTNEELRAKPAPKLGMSTGQVITYTNWGAPNSVNKTSTANGELEQWVYEEDIHRIGIQNGYLYFTNGVLTAIQSSN